MYTSEKAIETYKKVIHVCQTPGFCLEINRKVYRKKDLTYDFMVDNAIRIGYIETTDIPNSRIYLSTFIMLLLILSMDRRHDGEGIEFVGLSENIVQLIYRNSLWNVNSGYNTAMSDVKSLIGKLSKNSENVGATI